MQMYDNVPGLEQKRSQINKNATGAKFNQDWIDTTKTLAFQMHRLDGEVHTLGISFGKELLPPVTKVIEGFTDLLGFLDKNKGVAIALGAAITGVLVPAIGVYLKGALLSTNGAIMTTVKGYGNLIGIQSAEKRSILGLDASLAGEDAALSANDRALLTNRAAGAGGVGGMGGAGVLDQGAAREGWHGRSRCVDCHPTVQPVRPQTAHQGRRCPGRDRHQ